MSRGRDENCRIGYLSKSSSSSRRLIAIKAKVDTFSDQTYFMIVTLVMKTLICLSLFLGSFATPVPKPDPVLDESVAAENSDYLPSVITGKRRLGDEDAINETSPSVYVDESGSDQPPMYYGSPSEAQHQGYNPMYHHPQHGFPFYPGVHTYGWPQSPVFQNWNPQMPPNYNPPSPPWAGERPGVAPRPVQPVPGQVPRYNPVPPSQPPVGSPGGPPEIEEEAEVFPGESEEVS